MGQSRSRVQRFLAENPVCIFCGGIKPATTEDHVPAKTLFWGKKWPEGYKFAACNNCNNGSSDDDDLIGCFMKLGCLEDGRGQEIDQALRNTFFRRRSILEKMNPSPAEKRRLAKKAGLVPEPGETYTDLPILKVPTEVNDAIERFAKKLTKALHYKITGIIVPANAGIRCRWITNGNIVQGHQLLTEEIAKHFRAAPPLKRESIDLSPQFFYAYVVEPEKKRKIDVLLRFRLYLLVREPLRFR